MSERPRQAHPDGSRRRWMMRRFRDLPIWSKLGVIMIVPTLATIVVGTNGLVAHIDTASGADQARALARVSESAAALVHELQDERVAATMLLGADDDSAGDRSTHYADTQRAVDQAREGFLVQRAALPEVPASFDDLLDGVDGQLGRLAPTRGQVANGGIGIIAATAFYEDTILDLISLRDLAVQIAAATTDSELSDRMRAAVAVSQAKEFLSQRRVVGHVVLIRGAYNPYLRTAYIGAEAGLEQSLQAFSVVATASDSDLMNTALEGPEARQSRLYQGNLNSLDSGSLRNLPWDAQAWDEALLAHAEQMRDVERVLDGIVAEEAATLRDAATQRVLVEAGILLFVLAVAILLAWLVARSMVRSLRDLRYGALSVAQYGLPQAVARLRDPALSTQLSPEQVAGQIAEPLPVRSRDEFGQVAEAFNVVHLEAVRTAAEQAQLRSSVAAMFINLARRSQILVDRLINQLDRLERGEEDPDRLAELFQLDHLATRMRRTDENLLVLAGADSTRVQREPAAMIDVLRAAQSEVEHYTRIEFGVVDRDLEVAAHAVNDLVHLVAELLDNATAFSPPDSHVIVEARRVGDRAVLYVQDRGLGLSAEQLADINERLATPPLVDVAVSRMMGLVVVARLAARHGVKVELRPAPERGIVADVTLPSSVLVPRSLAGRPDTPTASFASPVGPAFPEPPSPAAQLALEGGQPPNSSGVPGGSFAAFGTRSPGEGTHPGSPPVAPAGQPSFASGFTPSPLNGPSRNQPPTRNGPRPLPAWSDLVGNGSGSSSAGSGHNGTELHGAPSGPPPLPRRRPDPPQLPPGVSDATRSAPPAEPTTRGGLPKREPRPASAPPTGTPAGSEGSIPRQRPVAPAAPPVPPAAPPPWPPVAAAAPEAPPPAPSPPPPSGQDSGFANGGGRPPAPLTAGQTAEIPRPYTPPPPPPPPPVGDQTMELPIFRELESVWFRTRPAGGPRPDGQRPGGSSSTAETTQFAVVPTSLASLERSGAEPAPAAEQDTPSAPATPAREPEPAPAAAEASPVSPAATAQPVTGEAVEHTRESSTTGRSDAYASDGWETAADDGWRAATTAARATVDEMTPAGLPKRRPMAQLVPGGVEQRSAPAATPATQRRSPEAVRGLLSAYHRGVQRGRGQGTGDEIGGSGGPQSTHAGKEQQT